MFIQLVGGCGGAWTMILLRVYKRCVYAYVLVCVDLWLEVGFLFYLFSDSDELSVSLPQTAHIKTPSPDTHLHKDTQVCEAEVSRT